LLSGFYQWVPICFQRLLLPCLFALILWHFYRAGCVDCIPSMFLQEKTPQAVEPIAWKNGWINPFFPAHH